MIGYGLLAQISPVTVKSPQDLCAYVGIKPEDNYESVILKNRVCPHSNTAYGLGLVVQPVGYLLYRMLAVVTY
jgi:hypothetical protein